MHPYVFLFEEIYCSISDADAFGLRELYFRMDLAALYKI